MNIDVKESVVIDERVVGSAANPRAVSDLPAVAAKQTRPMVVEIADVDDSEVDPDAADPSKPAITETAWFSIGLALVFKSLHVLMYFLSSPIWGATAGKTYKLLFTIVFCAVDFWVMKNVVGRKLVGMLWRRKEDETDDEDQWVPHLGLGFQVGGFSCARLTRRELTVETAYSSGAV